MNKLSQRVLSVLVATTTAVTLAACGGGSDKSVTNANGEIELEFWHSASGQAAAALDEVVKNFNDAHAGEIHVSAIYQGHYSDAIAKLANAVQVNSFPDIMQVNDTNTAYMKDTGITLDAEDLNAEAENKIDFDDLLPSVRQYYSRDDKLLSMPFMVSQPQVFLNPAIIEAAGLDISQPPTNRKELVDWAQKIKDTTGKAGVVFHIHSWWFEEWTAADGLEFCSPSNGLSDEPVKTFKTSDPKQIETWTDFQSLYQSGAALNVAGDGNNAQSAFAKGDVGMIVASSSALGNAEKNAQGFEPVVIKFPVNNREQGGTIAGGNSVWVLGDDPGSEKAQAAWTFLSYLPTPEAQQILFDYSGYLPISESAVQAAEGNADSNRAVMLGQLVDNKATTATGGCHSGALQQVREDVGHALDAVLNSGADPATKLSEVEKASVKKVEEYNSRAASQS